MPGLFPAFPQKIDDDDLLRRVECVEARIVLGFIRDSYSAFGFLPNSVASVWANETFKAALKCLWFGQLCGNGALNA